MFFEQSTQINCKPEQLWPFLEEPQLQKKWMKGLQSMELTSEGPTRLGSRFCMRIKEGNRVADYDGEFLSYNRPKELAVRFWGGGFKPGMAVCAKYVLVPHDGGTRLDYTCTLEADKLGFWLRVMMPLFRAFSRWQLKSFLKKLKQLAEAK